MNDHELLRQFAEDASEEAFRQLVERHGGLVYGLALRQLRRPHQAEEVTHAVFAALAKKAAGLPSGTLLAGWLFRATRFAAAKLQRDEERRQRREHEAAMMMGTLAGTEPEGAWEQVVPLLDAELESLGDKDRSAVLLRFFEDRSFKEVGEALGASEDAAKMRVSRALEKLRQRFVKRGVTLSAAGLAGAFGSQASAATAFLPPELTVSVTEACLVRGVSSALTEVIARKLMWWKWRRVLIRATSVVLAGFLLFVSWRGLVSQSPPPAAPAWPPNAMPPQP
ncbi:MAG: sigma-70 family RNA polymerase sigma factor [Verrucomicrobiales bacterium]|nr:sigma-70 family RNA polymerase sigma factor [Verrucomicrobiales bacterium]